MFMPVEIKAISSGKWARDFWVSSAPSRAAPSGVTLGLWQPRTVVIHLALAVIPFLPSSRDPDLEEFSFVKEVGMCLR